MNKEKDIKWDLLAKYLDQEIEDQERKEFEKIIHDDPEYEKFIASIQDVWKETKKKKNMIEVNTDSAWEKLKSRIENHKTEPGTFENVRESAFREILIPVFRIAAVILIIAGLSYLIYRAFIIPSGNNVNRLTVNSEPDRMMQTTLPDGSIVHLKANSSICPGVSTRTTSDWRSSISPPSLSASSAIRSAARTKAPLGPSR